MLYKSFFGLRVSATVERMFMLLLMVALVAAMPRSPEALVALGAAGSALFGLGTVDAQCLLSDAQAITADAVSTNAYNVVAGNDIGAGEPMCVVITVDVAADSTTGDETYAFELIQSTVTALTSPDVLARVSFTAAEAAAGALAIGKQVVLPIPSGRITKAFIGVNYDVGGTTPTITVTAAIKPMSQIENRKAYADGFTIS